jgi:prepilin-type N-terminal cleavage/methylation domain-containing protein
MVSNRYADSPKQPGFTVIELMVTLVIASVLLMMVTPIIRSSIAEHRALAMVAAVKADLEWARNNALSTNQTTCFYVGSTAAKKTSCHWNANSKHYFNTGINAFVDSCVQLSTPPHQMTNADLSNSNYQGVSCSFVFTNPPEFNGLGLNSKGAFTATIGATGTSRTWLLSLQASGDLTVKAQ